MNKRDFTEKDALQMHSDDDKEQKISSLITRARKRRISLVSYNRLFSMTRALLYRTLHKIVAH